MPRLDVLNVGLQITGDPKATKELQQSLAPAIATFSHDFSKSIAKVAKELGGELTETTKKFSQGFASADQIKRMEQAFYKGTEPIWKAMDKARKLEMALQKDLKKEVRARVELELKQLKDYTQKYQAAMKDQFKREVAHAEALFERKKRLAGEYNEWVAKNLEDQMDDAVESVGKGIGDVLKLNFRDALRGGGGMLSKLGAGLQQRGLEKQAAASAMGGFSGGGKMMEMLGGVVGKLGAVAAGMGAVFGGIAMLVKVLLDADAQTKEFNRDMVNTAGGLSMVGKSGEDAEERLTELRKAAIDSTAAIKNLGQISKVIKLGLTAKEYMEVTSKFEEMGVTFDKMRGNAKDLGEATENYTKYVKAAAMVSRNFGMSLTEATEKVSENMIDLNLNLDEVKEGFAAIGEAARESGYGTKRFFNMVLQATSGVTMYNVRLAGTSKLLQNLVRILGMKAGEGLLKDLSSKLQGESYEDRYRRILTTGGDVTGKVLRSEAKQQMAGVQRAVGGMSGTDAAKLTGKLTGGASAAFEAAKSGDVAALAKVSDKDRAVLIAALGKQDEALARRLDNLIDLAKGANGDIHAQVKALERLGPGGAIVMELNRVKGVLGKSLEEIKGIDAVAFQKMTGLSSEQADQLQKVARTVTGDFELAKAAATKFKGNEVEEAKWNEENKKSGLKIEGGVVKSAATGEEVKNTNDALLAWSKESHDENMKAMSEQEANSERIAENTYDLTNLYSQSMISILEDISGFVSDILVWLNLKNDPKPRQAAAAATLAAAEQRQEEISKKSDETNQILKDLREKKKGKLTDEDRTQVEEAIKKAKATQDALKVESQEVKSRKKAARGLMSGGGDEGQLFDEAIKAGLPLDQATQLATSGKGAEFLKQLDMAKRLAGSGVSTTKIENLNAYSESFKADIQEVKKSPEELAEDQQIAAEDAAKRFLTGLFSAPGSVRGSDYTTAATDAEGKPVKYEDLPGGAKQTDQFGNDWVWDKEEQKWNKQQNLQEKQKRTSDESLTELKKMSDPLVEMNERDKRQDFIKALESVGITGDAIAPLLTAETKEQFNVELAGLEAGEATKEKFGKLKTKRLQDGLVLANGQVYSGSPGDAVAFINEQGMRGGGKVGGAANVVFHIHATEGREDIVTDKVVAGLHQVYSVMTGDTAAVGV